MRALSFAENVQMLILNAFYSAYVNNFKTSAQFPPLFIESFTKKNLFNLTRTSALLAAARCSK